MNLIFFVINARGQAFIIISLLSMKTIIRFVLIRVQWKGVKMYLQKKINVCSK
jgi:hypothetical protein